jgi:metacaspase-1
MSLLSLTRTKDEADDEEALISSLKDIRLETTRPVCLQKKALLIGIQYYNSTNGQLDGDDRLESLDSTPAAGGQLKGPHVDVQNMRQLLLGKAFRHYHSYGFLRSDHFFLPDCYGFSPDDITVLIDDGNPKHVQPTKENLVSVCQRAIFVCLNN